MSTGWQVQVDPLVWLNFGTCTFALKTIVDMKEIFFIGLTISLLGCGGSLSDEQRKKLQKGMENQKIVKLSDSEIITASLERGRAIYRVIEALKFDSSKVDSVAEKYHVKIGLMVPGGSNALDVENQLIEAYVLGAETGSTQDNIQKLPSNTDAETYDSLLYSRPMLTPLPDGAVKVEGVWNIYLAKKGVILSMDKK